MLIKRQRGQKGYIGEKRKNPGGQFQEAGN